MLFHNLRAIGEEAKHIEIMVQYALKIIPNPKNPSSRARRRFKFDCEKHQYYTQKVAMEYCTATYPQWVAFRRLRDYEFADKVMDAIDGLANRSQPEKDEIKAFARSEEGHFGSRDRSLVHHLRYFTRYNGDGSEGDVSSVEIAVDFLDKNKPDLGDFPDIIPSPEIYQRFLKDYGISMEDFQSDYQSHTGRLPSVVLDCKTRWTWGDFKRRFQNCSFRICNRDCHRAPTQCADLEVVEFFQDKLATESVFRGQKLYQPFDILHFSGCDRGLDRQDLTDKARIEGRGFGSWRERDMSLIRPETKLRITFIMGIGRR